MRQSVEFLGLPRHSNGAKGVLTVGVAAGNDNFGHGVLPAGGVILSARLCHSIIRRRRAGAGRAVGQDALHSIGYHPQSFLLGAPVGSAAQDRAFRRPAPFAVEIRAIVVGQQHLIRAGGSGRVCQRGRLGFRRDGR